MTSRKERMDEHEHRLTHQDPANFDELSEYPKKAKDEEDEHDRMVRFLCTVGKLKSIDRTGWILEGRDIQKPESVSGHMYRMGIIAMLLGDDDDDDEDEKEDHDLPNGIDLKNGNASNGEKDLSSLSPKSKKSSKKLDISKVVQMSLIHDIAECIVGDITPFDGVTEEEKHRRELTAMKHLVSLLPPKSSHKLLNLYEEYEHRQSAESLAVKELDRFDVMLQAFQYERAEWNTAQRIVRFDEFFDSALKHVHNDRLRPMLLKVVKERAQFWDEIGKKGVGNGEGQVNGTHGIGQSNGTHGEAQVNGTSTANGFPDDDDNAKSSNA